MVNVRYYDAGEWTGVETDPTNGQQGAHQAAQQAELPVRSAYAEVDTDLPDYDAANGNDEKPQEPDNGKPKQPDDDKPKKPGDDKPKNPPGGEKPQPEPEPCPHPPGHFPHFPHEPPHCGPPHHHHPPHHHGPPGCGRGGRGGFSHHGPHGGRGGFSWGGRGGFPWGGGRAGGMMPPPGFMGQLGNDARFHMNAFHEAMRDGGNGAASDDHDNGISGEIDFRPRVDVFDAPGAWVLHVALPGARREDVGVTWEPALGAVRVGGVVYRIGDEAFLQTISSAERDVGVFERVVRLGERGRGAAVAVADAEAISARMMDGVLVVEVPKGQAEKAEARKVDIL